jgi:hypothetical protein
MQPPMFVKDLQAQDELKILDVMHDLCTMYLSCSCWSIQSYKPQRMEAGKLECTSLEGIQLFLVEVTNLAGFSVWCFSWISMF